MNGMGAKGSRVWRRSWQGLAGAALGGALFCAFPGEAAACGNAYIRRIDPEVRALNEAQAELSRDAFEGAARTILTQFPKAREANGAATDSAMGRARRILALVTVRSDGAWYIAGKLRKTSPAAATANLSWASTELERRFKASDDTTTRTELGEAKAALAWQKKAGRELLEKLAEKKLVTTSWGYLALARLREEAKESQGSEDALTECRRIAFNKATCKVGSKGTT